MLQSVCKKEKQHETNYRCVKPGETSDINVENIIILFLALVIDFTLGEYPRPLHPVVWLGKVISAELRVAPRSGRRLQLAYGIAMVTITIAIFALTTYLLLAYLRGVNPIAYVLVAAFFLKSTFSVRELRRTALRVKACLEDKNIVTARLESRALVSRDTSRLDEPHLVSATVESIAENTSDSLIAPLLYFLILGVPGAIAYRVVNTFDAMIGYRGEWEQLGKFAARLDDVANFVPARITALIIVLAAWICKKDMAQAWRVMLRDHKKTQSPNAGWTMGAIAGALGVQLEKAGHYKLGDNHHSLSVSAIDFSRKMVLVVAVIWSLVFILTEVIYLVTT